jgi:hypothetical protein
VRQNSTNLGGSCRYVVLAQRGGVIVHRCPHCGGVTLHMGAFSVRMDDPAFATLVGTLVDAHDALATHPVQEMVQ